MTKKKKQEEHIKSGLIKLGLCLIGIFKIAQYFIPQKEEEDESN